MLPVQQPLFPPNHAQIYNVSFPSTRFQGSKRKLSEWIWANVEDLQFDTVLDVFGGTGAVSHLFKRRGRQVIYNDNLAFNHTIGLALIENSGVQLTVEDVNIIFSYVADEAYPEFIQKTFSGIYFTDQENAWLDRITYNIDYLIHDPIKQALARFALFQACLVKRPYNLFHRANLYMRLAQVNRSFGNKSTWDTPFERHFQAFVEEANQAIFDNGRNNIALKLDAFETPVGADLVYLDPPYLNQKGIGVDYLGFYHFLEGLTDYAHWSTRIDFASKHKRLYASPSVWNKPDSILSAFEQVVARHRDSILVVSYRDDGIPSKTQLIELLRSYKRNVKEAEKTQKYALAIKNSKELLLIAT